MSNFSKFDIDNCLKFINNSSNINNISLQFSPEYQNEFQIDFYTYFKEKLNEEKNLYIIGDTSYSPCCCDEITAKKLNSNIIIRIGTSCFTRNKNLPIYYLIENNIYNKEESDLFYNNLNELIQLNINENKDNNNNNNNNIIILYNEKIQKNLINIYRDKLNDLYNKNNLYISEININDIEYKINKDNLLYGRNFISNNNNNPIDLFNSNSILIYIGYEEDELLIELTLRFLTKIKNFYLMNINNNKFNYNIITQNISNKTLYKHFNLIEYSKSKNVFGILIGSLSLPNLNIIIKILKNILTLNNKKIYTFLLGKITEEKLCNFTEFIDCFILIGCYFNNKFNFHNNNDIKILTPLDIKIAFDKEYKWDGSYSFDIDFIINNENKINEKYIEINKKNNELIKDLEKKCCDLQIKDKNEVLVNIFSHSIIEKYDKRKFKGLNDKENQNVEVSLAKKGKRGIPIKYEDI